MNLQRRVVKHMRLGIRLMLPMLCMVFGEVAYAFMPSNQPLNQATPSELRILAAGDQFAGTVQVATVFNFSPPRWVDASNLELGLGALSSEQDTRAFVSLGPVWRVRSPGSNFYSEFGFSPTVLGGSSFNGRDMGGNVHFTSSASAGWRFRSASHASLMFRIQHISNGSLHRTNPGMDMVGLSFSTRF